MSNRVAGTFTMRVAYGLIALLAWTVLPGAADEPMRPFDYGPLPRGAWACLGAPRFVSNKPVRSLAFSPDGKLLASGTGLYSPTANIHVYDLSTGQELHTLRGHQEVVVAVRFTSDNKKLISAAWDRTIRVWDVAGGKEVLQLRHDNVVTGLELTPDGKHLVSASQDDTIRVWDFASGKELRRMKCWATAISLAPDGMTLAAAAETVGLWNIQTGKQLRPLGQPEALGIRGVRFSPDGKTLAVKGYQQVSLWDVAAGEERLRLKGLQRPVGAMAFSADGKVLATGGGGYEQPGPIFKGWLTELKLWDVTSGKELRSCEGHTSYVTDVAFAPDDQMLASASDDFSVRLWDWKTGREISRFTGHSQEVTALAYTPDARTLCSSALDGTVRVWDAVSGKELAVLEGHKKGVMAVGVAPDGKTLATGGMDGTVRLWDLAERCEVRTLATDHGTVCCLAFSPDGRVLASGNGNPDPKGGVRFWDWQGGKELRRLEGQEGAHRLAFAPDGQSLAVGCSPRISVWEDATGKMRQQFDAHHTGVWALGYLPDGKLASGGGGNDSMKHAVRLWDPAGSRLHELGTGTGYRSTMAVSPDGRLVAGAFEETIRVWETATRHQIAEFRGHRRHASALAFCPDGRTLASGGADGAILFWDLAGRRKDGQVVSKPLQPVELDDLWKDLEKDDGWHAVWTLAGSPEQSVSFLRRQLPVVPKVDPLRLRRLLADLDAAEFAVREKATSELEALGEAAAPALQLTLQGDPNLEVRRRVQSLLEKLESQRQQETKRLPGPVVQILRAIEALERAGTPEALKALQDLAEGEPTARQTREAQAALRRLTTGARKN